MQLNSGKEVKVIASGISVGGDQFAIIDLGNAKYVHEGILSRFVLVPHKQIVQRVDNSHLGDIPNS